MNWIWWSEAALRFTEAGARFFWQGMVVVLLVGWLGSRMRARPDWRHGVYVTGLALLPVCFAVNLWWSVSATEVEAGLFSGGVGNSHVSRQGHEVGSRPRSAEPIGPWGSASGTRLPHELVGGRRLGQESGFGLAALLAPVVFSGYLGGLLIMAIRLSLGLSVGRRWRRRSRLVDPAMWPGVFSRLVSEFGLKAAPALVWSTDTAVPVVVGLLKPMLCLPVSLATRMSPEQIELILAHELAHLKRRDHWVVLLQRLAETGLFFHPGVWWLSRRLEEAREEACDDLVLARGTDRAVYAEALVSCAERAQLARGPLAAFQVAAVNGPDSALRRRVFRILGQRGCGAPRPGRSAAVLLSMGLATAALLPGLASGQREPAKPVTFGDLQARFQEAYREALQDPANTSNPERISTLSMKIAADVYGPHPVVMRTATEEGLDALPVWAKSLEADYLPRGESVRFEDLKDWFGVTPQGQEKGLWLLTGWQPHGLGSTVANVMLARTLSAEEFGIRSLVRQQVPPEVFRLAATEQPTLVMQTLDDLFVIECALGDLGVLEPMEVAWYVRRDRWYPVTSVAAHTVHSTAHTSKTSRLRSTTTTIRHPVDHPVDSAPSPALPQVPLEDLPAQVSTAESASPTGTIVTVTMWVAEVPSDLKLPTGEDVRARLVNQPDVDVLSAPRISVLSGREATIAVGEEIRMGAPDSPEDTETHHVGLEVTVLPEVRGDQAVYRLTCSLTEQDEDHADTLRQRQVDTWRRSERGGTDTIEVGPRADGRRVVMGLELAW